ncbi:MAG: type II toxin-antitoxin system VapC family toxin [Planctomycetaceae bacterium]
MISEPVLVDTGPLVAMLHKSDGNHVRCRDQAKRFDGPVFTCWPVITEAAWLLRKIPNGLKRLLDFLATADVTPLELDSGAPAWMNRARSTYEDLHPQLADLALLYVAQREQIRFIFTLDRRDFTVYRDPGGQPYQLLPE